MYPVDATSAPIQMLGIPHNFLDYRVSNFNSAYTSKRLAAGLRLVGPNPMGSLQHSHRSVSYTHLTLPTIYSV